MKKFISILFSIIVFMSIVFMSEYLLSDNYDISNQNKYAAIPPVKLPPVPPPDQR